MVWAISDKFSYYLLGTKVEVITDNSAVSFITKKKHLSALVQRWMSRLAPYDLHITYRAGSKNLVADVLSRQTGVIDECVVLSKNGDVNVNMNDDEVIEMYENDLDVNEIRLIPKLDDENVILLQKGDQSLANIMSQLNEGKPMGKYSMYDGKLLKNSKEGDNILVIPKYLVKEVLEGVHDRNGHQGIDRTLARVNMKYTWVGKYSDVSKYVNECVVCSISKNSSRKPVVNLGSLRASRPLELVFLDFITLDKATDGRESVLVITDAFTKYVKAVPIRNQTAVTVANILMNEWIHNFGTPTRIHTDQGRNFQAQVVTEMFKLFKVKQSRTTPYHPQGNGQCERMNRSILNLLRTLCEAEKKKWPLHLSKIIHAYNSTPHASTGYSPFYLMFAREENLPIDAVYSMDQPGSDMSWVKETKNKVCDINKRVQEMIDKRSTKLREGSEEVLEIGDLVRIRKRVLGRCKLENCWSDTVWKVEGRVGRTSAYRIECEMQSRVENIINLRRVSGLLAIVRTQYFGLWVYVIR